MRLAAHAARTQFKVLRYTEVTLLIPECWLSKRSYPCVFLGETLDPFLYRRTSKMIFKVVGDDLLRRVVLFSVSIALSYLNYRGLHIIGNAAVASTLYIIVPFVVMAALSVPHLEPRNWVQQDWSAVQWGKFINVMFW